MVLTERMKTVLGHVETVDQQWIVPLEHLSRANSTCYKAIVTIKIPGLRFVYINPVRRTSTFTSSCIIIVIVCGTPLFFNAYNIYSFVFLHAISGFY